MPRRPLSLPTLPERTVSDPPALELCLRELADHAVLAFDTEFVGEQSYRPELCLIQVGTPQVLYVIDPYECGPLDGFWALMHDPERVVIAHAAREEIRMCRFLSGQAPANIFDTQIAAGFIGLTHPISYAGLVQTVLGTRLVKGDTLSDWRRRPLTASQVRYAFDDVRYLIPAYTRLQVRLKKYNRTTWATEEFAAHTLWATGEAETVERWRKVKGSGALNRRELAVLRAAYSWREGVAQQQDRPARTVLRDDMMIEVAKRGAKKSEALEGIRGLPSRGLPELLRVVREAIALPLNQCPTVDDIEKDPPQISTLAAMLNVVLNDVCERLKLAQSLICSQQDLKDLIRARQPGATLPVDSPFSQGWRREEILPHLERVLSGGLAVRVLDATTASPLEYIELVNHPEP